MSDFAVSRIVPSTRDLHGAASTRGKSLSMLCLLGPGDHAQQARRLDALDVRGLACADSHPEMRAAATATASLPLLSLTPAETAEDAQRLRFNGADGVCLRLTGASDEQLDAMTTAVRSMRMMPLLLASNEAELVRANASASRAIVLRFDDHALLLRHPMQRGKSLIVWPGELSLEQLRALNGKVDAVVVPPQIHERADFSTLLDELDG